MYMNLKTFELSSSLAPCDLLMFETGGTIPSENDYEFVEVDDMIAPLISLLNNKGYYTLWSCSGHCDWSNDNGVSVRSIPYITFINIDDDTPFPDGWTKGSSPDGSTSIWLNQIIDAAENICHGVNKHDYTNCAKALQEMNQYIINRINEMIVLVSSWEDKTKEK